MKKLLKLMIIALLAGSGTLFAQGVSINNAGTDADASAMFDVSSTDKGILIPRMTQAERDAISSPATGLLIYQTDKLPGFYHYDGSSWSTVGSSSVTYGEMYESNPLNPASASTLSFPTAGDFYPWETAASGVLDNVTFTDGGSGSPDQLTILEPGIYEVNMSLSFSGSTFLLFPNDISAAIYVNNVRNNKLVMHRNVSDFNVGSANISGILDVTTANTTLDLRFASEIASQSISIYTCNVNVKRLK